MIYVCLYLSAIVLANLTITAFGPSVSIVNAFFLIGLDMTTRDRLHDAWRGRGIVWRMALLIGAGSMISWLLNREAGPVAIASFVAFASAAIVDAGAYHLLRNRSWMQRANGSNVLAAIVDSVVFPTLAFGGFLPWVLVGQFSAKVAGGAVWSALLANSRPSTHTEAGACK